MSTANEEPAVAGHIDTIAMTGEQWHAVKGVAARTARLVNQPYDRVLVALTAEASGAVLVESSGDHRATHSNVLFYRVHPDGAVDTVTAPGSEGA